MNNDLMKMLIIDENESEELRKWCNYIGFERYDSIVNLIRKYEKENISYKTLRDIARYDFNLSDLLHSMLKFFELRIRAFICNKYGDVKLSKSKFMYEISDKLSGNKKKIPCDTFYERKLKKECTMRDFLEVSSMETLLRVFLVIDDETLSEFGNVEELNEMSKFIKELRNKVAHGNVLVGSDIRIGNKTKSINELINVLLRFMPTDEMKSKRIAEINRLNNELLKNISNDLRDKIIIKITL